MILEVAILDVKPDEEAEFESTFARAQNIIASMPGYVSHQLQKCIEKSNRYLLLVNWNELEDHTVGFRGSRQIFQLNLGQANLTYSTPKMLCKGLVSLL